MVGDARRLPKKTQPLYACSMPPLRTPPEHSCSVSDGHHPFPPQDAAFACLTHAPLAAPSRACFTSWAGKAL